MIFINGEEGKNTKDDDDDEDNDEIKLLFCKKKYESD